MHLRIDSELGRRLAAHSGLSLPDYVVLVALTDHPNGRLPQLKLRHALGWEKSRLTHQINRMTTRGLVTKEKSNTDRRAGMVVLSPLGRSAIEGAAACHVAAVRELFIDHLDQAQLSMLGDIADLVLASEPEPKSD